METPLPIARPGDVCILVEPAPAQVPQLRRLQQQLQIRYGGKPQEPIHFTCQRFALPDASALPTIVCRLQEVLAAMPPITVRADHVELVEHPFWEFCVLRWELRLGRQMYRFAREVTTALERSGMTPHYPTEDGWRPHVTALVHIPVSHGFSVNGEHQGQLLYRGGQLVLSQVQEGKRFEILAKIDMEGAESHLRTARQN